MFRIELSMWSPDSFIPGRRWSHFALVVILCGPIVAGCGFRALHGKDSGASAARIAAVRVAPIPDRVGVKLYNLLRNSLNPYGEAAKPAYELRVRLTQSIHNLAIRKDEFATRANLILTASYSLVDKKSDKTVFATHSKSTNSYNILESYFATLSAEEDARSRAVRVLAGDIRNRIGIFLARPTAARR